MGETSHIRCSLCLHTKTGVAPPADTIINGHAVCYDHMGYVQGGAWSIALAALKRHLATQD